MSAVLSTPATTRVPAAATRPRAMLALARVESVRLLRHPVTVVAGLLFLGPWVYGQIAGSANRFPVLHDDVVIAQLLGFLVLGGGTLIAANMAALRGHRHHTDALYDVLVLPAAWRTGALLLALLPCAGLAAILVGIRAGTLAALPGAAGQTDWAELLTTPAVVLLLGALGVLLARLVRSAVVAPLAALAIAAAAFVGAVSSAAGASWRVLLPVILPELPVALPADLVGRPAARHLAYLGGLILLLAVAALGRSGARGRGLAASAATAAVITAGAGAAQYLPDESLARARATATHDPASRHACRAVEAVTYCAFDDFTAWVDGWHPVVRGVRRAVPGDVSTGPALAVRQRVRAHDYPVAGAVTSMADDMARAAQWRRADATAGTPEAVTVGTNWGDARSAAQLAAAVAYRLVTGHAHRGEATVCGARGALLVWLVGQATPATAAGLHDLDQSSWGALTFTDPGMLGEFGVPDADAASGLALLDRPVDEASALVHRHWAQLTAADTGVDRFAALLGVPAAAQPPAEERPTCTG